MLATYEAVMTGDTVVWQDTPPQLEQQKVIITVLSPNIDKLANHPIRKLGTLAGKASVSFSDDWEISDEQFVDGTF